MNINISLSSVCRGVVEARLKRKRTASRLLGMPTNDQILEFYSKIKACEGRLILSIDEMYASERVVPTHAYVPDGEEQVDNLIAYKKGGWTQRTLIQCAASDGSMFHKIKQGTSNRECFEKYIEDLPYPRGTVLLLDNSPTHKKLEGTFARKGYEVIFLPPYSPMFQPVESVFSKVKREFRSKYPWTTGVENELEECVKNVNSCDVKGFFRLSARKLHQKVAAIIGIAGV
jgi:transposase